MPNTPSSQSSIKESNNYNSKSIPSNYQNFDNKENGNVPTLIEVDPSNLNSDSSHLNKQAYDSPLPSNNYRRDTTISSREYLWIN